MEKVAGSTQTGRTGKTTAGQRSEFVREEPLVSERRGRVNRSQFRDLEYVKERLRALADKDGLLPTTQGHQELRTIVYALNVYHNRYYRDFARELGLVTRIGIMHLERRGLTTAEAVKIVREKRKAEEDEMRGRTDGGKIILRAREEGREELETSAAKLEREERRAWLRARFSLGNIEKDVRCIIDEEGRAPSPEDGRITAIDLALQLYHGRRYADFVEKLGIPFAEPPPPKSLLN